MDLQLFREILDIESTTLKERTLAEFLEGRFMGPVEGYPSAPACSPMSFDVGDGGLNLLFDWSGSGCPSFVFCTHLDTVPPYIAPSFKKVEKGDLLPDGKIAENADTIILGRGSCDAKGQIFSMYTACRELEARGFKDFGLLLLCGEETGSFGAKAYSRDCPGGRFVLVGEPTDNMLVSASKGTKAFQLKIFGKPCHSGYPGEGESAVDKFVGFMNLLSEFDFPEDPVLGATTWNVGMLSSPNAQNVLSPEVDFRLYFRTTFASDELIYSVLEGLVPYGTSVGSFGGDTPLRYFCNVDGIPSGPVSFGSDAPTLTKFPSRAICGPGSILTAHTDREYVLLSDLEKAVDQDILIFKAVMAQENLKK